MFELLESKERKSLQFESTFSIFSAITSETLRMTFTPWVVTFSYSGSHAETLIEQGDFMSPRFGTDTLICKLILKEMIINKYA